MTLPKADSSVGITQAKLVIVGAGPGGIAAASTALAHCGDTQRNGDAQVVLIDEQPSPGGQIWRGQAQLDPVAIRWIESLDRPGLMRIQGQVIGADNEGGLVLETAEGPRRVVGENLILATGARERFVPFPGWTLPGVCGIGGLQAMMKSGWPVEGKRIVIAGSGPLMFPVAATARKFGAKVLEMAEQVALPRLAWFGLHLLPYPEKIIEAISYLRKVAGIKRTTGTWVQKAGGKDRLEWVELTNGKTTRRIECDFLAAGIHLVPNTELASLLGCQIDAGGRIQVDGLLKTSKDRIFAVGECTGVGGADRALVQGKIAALTAMGRSDLAKIQQGALTRWDRFSRLLDDIFAPRKELGSQIQRDTIVCRCEDIPHERLKGFDSWREAKLQTRCGMGPCQGRVCGPAASVLYGWGMESVRPPVLPCQGRALLELDRTEMNS